MYGKNPTYWQAGAPKVPCLEYQETTSNDAALLAIQSGKVDWTHNFVPNVESAYEAKDPAHYHAFYAHDGVPGVAHVRRHAVPVQPRAAPPGDQHGDQPQRRLEARRVRLRAAHRRDRPERHLPVLGHRSGDQGAGQARSRPTTRTPPRSCSPTDGFTYNGSKLIDPKGNPVSFQIHVISGWSDWVASLQIITKNLQAIGIDATVQLEPDWNSWYPSASSTKAPTLLWQAASQGSPYGFFYANLHQNALIPSGQDAHRRPATGSTSRIPARRASSTSGRRSLKPDVQHALATKLQAVWLKTLPVIPLFIGPRWSTYSTKYFHGFASPKNYYGDPIFTTFPDNVLSFTRIAPARRPVRDLRSRSRPPDPAGGGTCPARRAYSGEMPMRWLIRRMLLLRVRPVGRDHAQLPVAAAHAGRPRRRHAGAAEPVADPVEPGDHRDLPRACSAAGTSRCSHAYFWLPRPDRHARLRHLDVELPDATCPRSSGARCPYSIFLVGVAFILAFVLGITIGMIAAWRRGGAVDNVVVPTLLSLSAFPAFFTSLVAVYFFGLKLGWFPLAARLRHGARARLQLHVPRERVPPRAAADPRHHARVRRRLGAQHAHGDDQHDRGGLRGDGRGQGPAATAA